MSNYSTLEMAKSTLVRAAFEMAALVFSLVVSVRGGICGSGISGDVFCHSRISGVMRGIGIGVVMKHSCMNGSCINSSCMNSSCMNRSCMNGSCTNGNVSYMNASCVNGNGSCMHGSGMDDNGMNGSCMNGSCMNVRADCPEQ